MTKDAFAFVVVAKARAITHAGPQSPGCLEMRGAQSEQLRSHSERDQKRSGPVTSFLEFSQKIPWLSKLNLHVVPTLTKLSSTCMRHWACCHSAAPGDHVICVIRVYLTERAGGVKPGSEVGERWGTVSPASSIFSLQGLGSHPKSSLLQRGGSDPFISQWTKKVPLWNCAWHGVPNMPPIKRLNRWTLRIGIRSRKNKKGFKNQW